MELPTDFRDLFACFNARRVEYIIAGSYALAFHGAPRNTGDIDVLVKPDADNAQLIVAALADFGFVSDDLSPRDFVQPGQVVQLGHPPLRVDLMTSLSGVSWDEAEAGRLEAKLDGVSVHFLGREQYIANKRAAARPKDLADLDALGEHP